MDENGAATQTHILRNGWHIAWNNRYAMLAYTLIVWVVGLAFLAPLIIWVLHQLGSGGDVIVGNYNIHRWLLTPKGLTYFMMSGSLLLFFLILQGTGLYLIAHTPHGENLSARQALTAIVVNTGSLFQLSVRVFLVFLPAIPLVTLVPGAAYLSLLTKHDINFYLTHHPPEWIFVIAISIIWIVTIVGVILFVLTRWIFVLPLWLEKVRPFRLVLKESWHITRGQVRWIFTAIMTSLLVTTFAGFLLHVLIFGSVGLLLEHVTNNLNLIVSIIMAYLILNGITVAIAVFLGLAWVACVWESCYRYINRKAEHTLAYKNRPVFKSIAAPSSTSAIKGISIAITLILLLAIISGGISTWIIQRKSSAKVPLIIAHRAGAADAPENTTVALKRVLKDGIANMAEIDVTLTSDGLPVIAHDKDLMRQAGDPRIIAETKFTDLQRADIGSYFSPKFKGLHIEPLEDFLKTAKDRIPLIVEFKHGKNTNLVERVIKVIQKYDMQDGVTLMSLELDEVRQVQNLAPKIKVGYFASIEVGDLRKLDVNVLGIKDHMAKASLVNDVRNHGTKVYVWTIDDPQRVMELIELGVDGIITNNPAMVAEVIKHFNALTPEQRILLRFRDFWNILGHNHKITASASLIIP
jgi:glycerophosphoryl diester phosphodiesterase